MCFSAAAVSPPAPCFFPSAHTASAKRFARTGPTSVWRRCRSSLASKKSAKASSGSAYGTTTRRGIVPAASCSCSSRWRCGRSGFRCRPPVPVRKAIMVAVSVLALGWFWVFFLPIVRDPGMLTTEIVHHSIQYEYPNLPIYEYISKTPLRVLYFATIAISFIIASQRFGTLPGIILGISAAVAAVAFHYAYVSV